MDKAYNPKTHDAKWQNFWEKSQLSEPKESTKSRDPFVIMMPPPNVTGVLHQGHALMLALQDTLVRWRRMCGDDALYLPGTDHASIAVQMMVVKKLAADGIDFKSLGREAFVEECWKWVELYRPRIFSQIKSMGISCDWSRARFTLDPELNKAVGTAFIELHKKGLAYRAERLINWSPKGQTGLSDLEVIHEERESFLWHMRYPDSIDPSRYLVVATTRPETMLGDTAVAVHPDDERYKDWIGRKIKLPLVGREIPVVADTFVDKDFGSGVVKITPAHDFNDFEVGERHGLEKINVLNPDATIVAGLPNEAAALAGLSREQARERVVQSLEGLGLMERIEPHKNRVGISERWGDVVEPYLSQQWYIRMDGMAKKALQALEQDELNFVPAEFANQFRRWMEGIKDWCISRQLWWGQPIPAHYCKSCGHIEVSLEAPTAPCAKCGADEGWRADEDVFDTWFSSGLWPFSTLGWPDKNSKDFQRFYPGSVLETGFDILFFWVARMVMLGVELTGKIPFSRVYLHPMVRDEYGQKMSKTKGNVIDPLEIMGELGADTLRLTLNGLCVQGRDMRLSTERLEGYRNFINKVWNATRFVLMAETEHKVELGPDAATLGATVAPPPKGQALHDKWIIDRLHACARDVNKAWSEFRMQEATERLYHFVWDDYCGWYLECAKLSREQSQPVLLYVLEKILRLLHPLCPHVTEELWHELPGVPADACLALQAFPDGESFPEPAVQAEFAFLQDCITALRNLRSENNVKPSVLLDALAVQGPAKSLAVIEGNTALIEALAKMRIPKDKLFKTSDEGPALDALLKAQVNTCVSVRSLEAGEQASIYLATAALVDVLEERERLTKEATSLEALINKQEAKLGNESFVERAPPEVVDKERIKLQELKARLERTRQAAAQLGKI